MIGRQFQHPFESEEGRLGVLQPQMAYAQAEMRFQVRRVQRGGFMKRLRSFVPVLHPLQADTQVEPSFGVLRLEFGEAAIAVRGVRKRLQLELDVPHRAIQFRRRFAGIDGALQLLQRLLALARQVQRDRARQGAGGSGGWAALLVCIRLRRTDRGNLEWPGGNSAHRLEYSLLV